MSITKNDFNIIYSYKNLEKISKTLNYTEQDILILLKFMYELTPTGFEYYVKDFFKNTCNYDRIKVTGGIKDGGIDIIGKYKDKYTLIQCKKYQREHVRDREILKFIADTNRIKNELGKSLSLYFITTTWANNIAWQYANTNNIDIKYAKDILKMNKKFDINTFIKKNKNNNDIVSGLNIENTLNKHFFKQGFGKIFGSIIYYIIKIFHLKYELDFQKVEEYYPKKNEKEKVIMTYN